MFNQELFSGIVKSYRGEKTLREFAEECGVSIATLSRIENGNPPDINTFMTICKTCKVNPILFMKIDRFDLLEMKELPDISNASWEQISGEFHKRINKFKEIFDKQT